MGEKLDQIEAFHPDRMASRILGMGDVLSLIEKAEQSFDQKKAMEEKALGKGLLDEAQAKDADAAESPEADGSQAGGKTGGAE